MRLDLRNVIRKRKRIFQVCDCNYTDYRIPDNNHIPRHLAILCWIKTRKF